MMKTTLSEDVSISKNSICVDFLDAIDASLLVTEAMGKEEMHCKDIRPVLSGKAEDGTSKGEWVANMKIDKVFTPIKVSICAIQKYEVPNAFSTIKDKHERLSLNLHPHTRPSLYP